jgi:hypothetical protein
MKYLHKIYFCNAQVNLEFEKSGDDLQMHFPLTIATVPFRIPNSVNQPSVKYGIFILTKNFFLIFMGSMMIGCFFLVL